MIRNPILPGAHPDPSILHVGDDYYIATSTFEWLPGIQIHHSRDLKHWRPFSHALTRPSQLTQLKTRCSTGVWAPCLTYNETQKKFYLTYTLMHSQSAGMFDLENLVVTADSIEGPWSDPIYLNSSGFDPSFFHDDNGRQWVAWLVWDFREGYEHPGFICVQEYSATEQCLIGERHDIFHSPALGCAEAPHIYKRDGYYYLMTAEGGTGYGHACTLSRSRSILGPYEYSPYNPLFTSTNQNFNGIEHLDYRKVFLYNPDSVLQKSGHGSLMETQNGEFYVAHLCARPLLPELRCTLGRETALQKVEWTSDGWLRLSGGGHLAQLEVPSPALPEFAFPPTPVRDDFDSPKLGLEWQTLRTVFDESWGSLTERPGFLRLRGRESLCSMNRVSLLARRIESFHFEAETCVEFEPRNFQQMAGLVCIYDNINHHYLRVYYSDSLQSKCIGIMSTDNGTRSEHREHRVAIPSGTPVRLKVVMQGKALTFYYGVGESAWASIGPVLDASTLSDEYCVHDGFTGAFVGITAQDFHMRRSHADFDYFEYREIEHPGTVQ